MEKLEGKIKMPDMELGSANILIAGCTGSGKSTLVNAVFHKKWAETGVGRPVTKELKECGEPDDPVHIWDTEGLEISEDGKQAQKVIEGINSLLKDRGDKGSYTDVIHCIWYCLSATSARYQEAEQNFIKALHNENIKVPFIIVLTRCASTKEELDNFEAKVRELNQADGLDDIDIVQVLAKGYETPLGVIPPWGLQELVNLTLEKLPEFARDAFIAAQEIDVQKKRKVAEGKLHKYVIEARDSWLDKIPIYNLISTQVKLYQVLSDIAKVYDESLSKEDIEKVWKTGWSWSVIGNTAGGTVLPFLDMNWSNVLNDRIKEGKCNYEDVGIKQFGHSEQTAVMLAIFGEEFIASLEELWEMRIKKAEVVDQWVAQLSEMVKAKMNKVNKDKVQRYGEHRTGYSS